MKKKKIVRKTPYDDLWGLDDKELKQKNNKVKARENPFGTGKRSFTIYFGT